MQCKMEHHCRAITISCDGGGGAGEGGVFWGWGVVAGLFGDGRMGCPGRSALQGMGISRNLQQPSLAVIHL